MEALKVFLLIIIFPGLLISAVIGTFLSSLDSYITALFGKYDKPKILQPFMDFIHFDNIKQIKIKQLLLPILQLVLLITMILFVPIAGFNFFSLGFDMVLIIYLLGIPKLLNIGADAFRIKSSDEGGIGKRVLDFAAYEIPFIIIMLTVIIFIGLSGNNRDFSYTLTSISKYQLDNGSLMFKYQLLPAALSYLLLVHLKAGKKKYEISDEKLISKKEKSTSKNAKASSRKEKSVANKENIVSNSIYFRVKNLNHSINMYLLSALFVALFLGGITFKIVILDFLIFFILTILIGVISISFGRNLINKYFGAVLKYFKFAPSILAILSLLLVLLRI